MSQQKSLRAWLEFADENTGPIRRVVLEKNTLTIGRAGSDLTLSDPHCSNIHAVLTQENGQFILRDLSSENGTFVNERSIVEARLNHLDRIRLGGMTLIFNAAFKLESEPTFDDPKPAPKPPMLHPLLMFTQNDRFWAHALNDVLTIRQTWLTLLLNLFAVALVVGAGVSSRLTEVQVIPLVQIVFFILSATLSLGLMAMTCSVFFAFDSAPDAPHKLSQSLRFTFFMSPTLLLPQCLFLTWAGLTHPNVSLYVLVALVPATFYLYAVTKQSQQAFDALTSRAMAFALTASVPWNIFMFGLMWFAG